MLCSPMSEDLLRSRWSSCFLMQPLSSAQLRRNRDKLVSLLEEGQLSQLASGEVLASTSATASGHLAGVEGDEELPDEPSPVAEGVTGRITIYCTASRWGEGGSRSAQACPLRQASFRACL